MTLSCSDHLNNAILREQAATGKAFVRVEAARPDETCYQAPKHRAIYRLAGGK